MANILHVTRAMWTPKPATEEEAVEMWEADKDFYIIREGQYISKSDWGKHGNALDSVVFVGDNMHVFFEYGL